METEHKPQRTLLDVDFLLPPQSCRLNPVALWNIAFVPENCLHPDRRKHSTVTSGACNQGNTDPKPAAAPAAVRQLWWKGDSRRSPHSVAAG